MCKVRPIRLSDASGTDRHGPVEEAGPVPAARRIGNRSRLLHYFSTNRVDSRGLRGTPVDSAAADKRLTSNVLDHKLRVVSQLPKRARTGSTPASAPTDIRALKVPVDDLPRETIAEA